MQTNPGNLGSLTDHFHVYVDASFDDDGYSGIGGALHNSSGQATSFFSEKVDSDFTEMVKHDHQKNIIQELEMLALLTAIETWGPVWEGHRVVAFTDSESVRGSFLKTWSKNCPCNKLLARIFFLEETHTCPLWLERVPSQSNPSDVLSRSQVAAWKGLTREQIDFGTIWSHAIQIPG